MPVAVRVALLPLHIVTSLATGAAGIGIEVVTIVSDTAGDPLTQAKLEVMCTVTESLFANEVVVYEMLSVPTGVVPTYHWYAGVVPPFVGVAVKVTSVPEQIVLSASLDAIVTLAGRIELTVVAVDEVANIAEQILSV